MNRRFALTLICCLLLLPGVVRAEEGSFDSGGVKIHYTVEGEGEPVLLIHGFAVNAQLQWGATGVIKALAKDHRVIAFDCRGHGKSGKPADPKKYGIEMVEDAVRLLDHLKIKKVHLVGYSMGALLAGKMMVEHPNRLLSATLGGAGPSREGVKPPPFIEELADSLEKGKGLGPLVLALTPAGKPKPSKGAIDELNYLLVKDNGKALAGVVRGWKELVVSYKQLKANRVPALGLVGALDPLKISLDDLKKNMPNLRVVAIGKTDHFTVVSHPQFVKELKKFLDAHAQRKKAAPLNR
jgi:pimeloyl-ACP methyl ester carboxylesterase